jgi:two-component system chemotaxis response regulator CheB
MASAEFDNLQRDLLRKVTGIKNIRIEKLSRNLEILQQDDSPKSVPERTGTLIEAVAIGSSTGGPAALKIILSKLPSDFPAGIAISQHMPKGFTASFAERLNAISKIYIKEASEGDEFAHGKVLICPGGFHMFFKKRGSRVFAAIKETKSTDKYTPSVDIMMSSLADIFGRQTMGIVVTGMGNDGKTGMLEIKSKGGYTIAESADTAVVYGMPAEVIKAGAAERVLPISQIPLEMIKIVCGNEL